MNYEDVAQTELPSQVANPPPYGGNSTLRRDVERAIVDSFDLAVQQERAVRKLEAQERDQLLEFERETGTQQVRRSVAEIDSTLNKSRREATRLDQRIKALRLDLEVYRRNLTEEPEVWRTAKRRSSMRISGGAPATATT